LPALERSGLKAGVDFNLVFSPERVKSLSVLGNLTMVPKIVGGCTEACASRGQEFYADYLGAPVINVGTLEASEFSKLAGMVYRDANISLANELAAYADAIGVDFEVIRRAANTDGEAYLLEPGIGVGGHCTPVYPNFAIQDARARGFELPLTALARACNEQQPVRQLDRLERAGARLNGSEVTLLGLAFRPDVKEHTCSPAFPLAAEAARRGATVWAHDPLYTAGELRALGFNPTDLAGKTLPPITILNTAHSAYREIDFADWHARGVRYILDGRNTWARRVVEAQGITYVGIGR
jgi:nucleotide sugar dehydrogenase